MHKIYDARRAPELEIDSNIEVRFRAAFVYHLKMNYSVIRKLTPQETVIHLVAPTTRLDQLPLTVGLKNIWIPLVF